MAKAKATPKTHLGPATRVSGCRFGSWANGFQNPEPQALNPKHLTSHESRSGLLFWGWGLGFRVRDVKDLGVRV